MDSAAGLQPLPNAAPWRKALLHGACFGVLALCCNLLMLLFVALLPAGMRGPSAAAALLNSQIGAFSIVFLACIVFPIYETVLAQFIPFELLRKLKVRPGLCVALCSVLFGLGHFVNGGLGHGMAAVASGAIFALAYAYERQSGARAAFAVTALAHIVNNSLTMLLSAYGPALPG